jgi:hypothetical protein
MVSRSAEPTGGFSGGVLAGVVIGALAAAMAVVIPLVWMVLKRRGAADRGEEGDALLGFVEPVEPAPDDAPGTGRIYLVVGACFAAPLVCD